MTENIHDDDELYRKAYNNFEEEPSPEVWQKLNARLDGQDAAAYRAKFITWRRVAVMLLFLLGSAAAYEIFFRGSHSSSTESAEKKVVEPVTPVIDSATPPSSSNSSQSQHPAADSLNGREAINTIAPGENKKQATAPADTAMTAEAVSQEKNLPRILPGYPKANSAVTQANNADGNLHKEAVRTPANNAIDATKNSRQEPVEKTSEQQDIAEVRHDKESSETVLQKENISKHNDSVSATSSFDSAAVVKNQPDSTTTNLTAVNKQSTIKINKLFKPRFSLSPYVGVDIAGRQMDNDEHHREPGSHDERDEIEKRENNQLSYSAGLLMRYTFSKKFSLKSGLIYSNTAIHIKPEILYASKDNNLGVSYKYVSSLGYGYVKPSFDQSPAIGDSIRCDNAEQHAGYLSIPMMVGYTFNVGKKFSIIPGAGFTTHLLLGSKVETEVRKDNEKNNVTIKNLKGLAPVYFSFATDAELHYQLSNKLSVMLLPSFKYAVVPTTSNHVVKTYPYNFGVGVGVTYGL